MNVHSTMERDKLVSTRFSLLNQAEIFLKERDYEHFSDIFAEIAEISSELGQEYVADEIIEQFPELRALLIGTNAPLEPEILDDSQIENQLDQAVSLISQRRTTAGIPLESGIVPIIVKSDREILNEILTENLPYLPENEIKLAVDTLVKIRSPPKRNALLKVFLIKNQKYATATSRLVENKLAEKKTWFIAASQKELKGKIGLFDPLQMIENMDSKDLKYLLDSYSNHSDLQLRKELLLKIYEYFQSTFEQQIDLKPKYKNILSYLGHFLFTEPNLSHYFEQFDIISKHEFNSIFADFCADNQIEVYDLFSKDQFPWDSYLAKKNGTNKTGLAMFLRGFESIEKFQDTIKQLNDAIEYCNFIYLVTTPLGVIRIGLNRLFRSVREIGAWVYIVDPIRRIIYGLIKGNDNFKINKEKEKQLRDSINFALRPLDPNKKLSKYRFERTFQFKPKTFLIFGLNKHSYKHTYLEFIEHDRTNLQYLLLLHRENGITINFFKWIPESLDPDLISGFISALDSFGNNFGETKGLQEIQYSGFTISFAQGQFMKACLFLKETPSPRLKELLYFLVYRWESLFEEEMKSFKGSLNPFINRKQEIIHLLNRVFLRDLAHLDEDEVVFLFPLPF